MENGHLQQLNHLYKHLSFSVALFHTRGYLRVISSLPWPRNHWHSIKARENQDHRPEEWLKWILRRKDKHCPKCPIVGVPNKRRRYQPLQMTVIFHYGTCCIVKQKAHFFGGFVMLTFQVVLGQHSCLPQLKFSSVVLLSLQMCCCSMCPYPWSLPSSDQTLEVGNLKFPNYITWKFIARIFQPCLITSR